MKANYLKSVHHKIQTLEFFGAPYNIYKRASLACAARLADTSCPSEAPFGRLEVTLVNYKGDNISKYVHLSVKTDFTRKITKFVNFKIFGA